MFGDLNLTDLQTRRSGLSASDELLFKFQMMTCFTSYGVIAEKPRIGKLGQIFPCTL